MILFKELALMANCRKKMYDLSDFSDPQSALDLRSHSIRESMEYDAFGNQTRFMAMVVSPPLDLNPNQLSAITGAEQEGSSNVSKFIFRGRILGPNSPHKLLPDPCSIEYAADADGAMAAACLHTTFFSSATTSVQRPGMGDIVTVELKCNNFSYDLQYGEYVGLSEKAPPGNTALASAMCQNLANNFNNATSAPGGGSSCTEASGDPFCKAPLIKCAPGSACTAFREAKHYGGKRPDEKIRLICLHITGGRAGSADSTAQYFAGEPTNKADVPKSIRDASANKDNEFYKDGSSYYYKCNDSRAPKFARDGWICQGKGRPYFEKSVRTSTHYVLDETGTVIQCVPLENYANGNSPFNYQSISYEHKAGADYNWDDGNPGTEIMLKASAKLSAALCHKYNIAPQYVGKGHEYLKAHGSGYLKDESISGFIGHQDISTGKPICPSGATPGGFPWRRYVSLVAGYLMAGDFGVLNDSTPSSAVASVDSSDDSTGAADIPHDNDDAGAEEGGQNDGPDARVEA